MDLDQAAKIINFALKKHQPKKFSGTWVYRYTPKAYRYIWKNVRTELGDIDWDAVTCKLDKEFQERWINRRTKRVKAYQSIAEVRKVMKKFHDKRYVFLAALDDEDKALRDTISVALARVAQKGNVRAQQELVSLLRDLVNQWIDYSPRLRKWKNYSSDIDDKIKSCIRCYKFTGTFIGYLFITLERSGWGLRPVYVSSLDEPILDGARRRIENVVQDPETGEITVYNRANYSIF